MHERAQAQRRTSTLAVVSLVFGLLGWTVLPVIGSLIAIVIGHMARRKIRQSFGEIEGDGIAVAGLVLGWVPIILAILTLIVSVFLVAGILTGSIVLVFVALLILAPLMIFSVA